MSEHHTRFGLVRTRWAAIGAAVAVTLGAGGLGLAQATIDSGDRPVTVSITAERILDTRTGLGISGRITDATPRDLQVTGSVPVASGGQKTVVPPDAVGVLVNVTVVNPDSAGYLALRPAGTAGIPKTSTVNFAAGSVEPNAATVDLGPGGKIQVWLKTAATAGAADVLVDVVGYTIDHTHDDVYYTKAEMDAALAEKANALLAVVDFDGSLVSGSQGATATKLPGTGAYQIDFGIDLTSCVLIATLGSTDSTEPPSGEIGTAFRDGNTEAVLVRTYSSAGGDADRSFHLAVGC